MSEAEAPAPSRGRQPRANVDAKRRERRYQPGTDAEGTNFHLWWINRSSIPTRSNIAGSPTFTTVSAGLSMAIGIW